MENIMLESKHSNSMKPSDEEPPASKVPRLDYNIDTQPMDVTKENTEAASTMHATRTLLQGILNFFRGKPTPQPPDPLLKNVPSTAPHGSLSLRQVFPPFESLQRPCPSFSISRNGVDKENIPPTNSSTSSSSSSTANNPGLNSAVSQLHSFRREATTMQQGSKSYSALVNKSLELEKQVKQRSLVPDLAPKVTLQHKQVS